MFYGREIWGNGDPLNQSFEDEIRKIILDGGLILDVGSGRYKIHEDCIGVDAYTDNPTVNIQAYMWDMPFDNSSVDAIFCFSSLEHVSKYQVLPTLAEFQRVLKPGKPILLLVPDLIYVLSAFLDNPSIGWEMDLIFGVQTHDGKTINDGEFHRTGFTGKILKQYIDQIPGLKMKELFIVNAYNQNNIGALILKDA